MTGKKIKLWVIRIAIVAAVFLFILFMANREETHLRDYKILTTGVCSNIDFFTGGDGFWVYYDFTTNKNISQKSRHRILIQGRYVNIIKPMLVNKRFPVIYDSTEISNNAILIMKKDYLRFDCQIPDSLLPVINYLDSVYKN